MYGVFKSSRRYTTLQIGDGKTAIVLLRGQVQVSVYDILGNSPLRTW